MKINFQRGNSILQREKTQHNGYYQTMLSLNVMKWTNPMIDALNEQGALSTPYLMMHFGLLHKDARNVLKSIVEDYENVKYNSTDHIYIED